jgi:hypothetical protein
MSQHPDEPMYQGEQSDLGSLSRPGASGLGSLAQAARTKHLYSARRIMIVIGAIMVIGHIFMAFNAENEVRNEMQKGQLDADEVVLVWIVRAVYGAFALLGVVFIVLGLLTRRFPVAATVTGFVVYLLMHATFAVHDPATLVEGIIFKIIVVVCMAKAIQAAAAYQRESREAAVGDYSA